MALMAAANHLSAKARVHQKVVNVGLGVIAGVVLAWVDPPDFKEAVYSLKFLFAAAIAPPIIFDL